MKKTTSKTRKTKPLNKHDVMRSCPFCGCTPKITKNHNSTTPLMVSSFEVSISCKSAKCRVKPSLTGYNRFAHSNEEKKEVVNAVIKQWNTRA